MSLKKFSFNVIKKDGFARLGQIHTHRGDIDTPVFMPVGTQATIKGAFIDDIIKTDTQIILSTTQLQRWIKLFYLHTSVYYQS